VVANILIVEDEESILELIAINLHQAGFNPIRSLNAEYAENIISEALPDLIILDWMLPGMSGVEFAKRVRGKF
jgi:two-component system phosphate regulon response regulator PhoB